MCLGDTAARSLASAPACSVWGVWAKREQSRRAAVEKYFDGSPTPCDWPTILFASKEF
jgi:hypothetical protein